MRDETIPDAPAWHSTPWSATHKETLRRMLFDSDQNFVGANEAAAIEAALTEIARLGFALETVAKIARAAARIARAAKDQERH